MTINEGVTVNNTGSYSSLVQNGYYNGFDNNKKFDGSDVTAPDPNLLLTINGGTFTGGKYNVKNDDCGSVVINGGTFSGATQAPVLNWHKTKITNGTFKKGTYTGNVILNGKANDTCDIGKLEITGGDFEGNIYIYTNYGYSSVPSISGGTFTTDVSDYCADGFSAKFINGKYVVDNSADTLNLLFNQHNDDKTVYDIVLNGDDKDINRLNTADFEFKLTTSDNITYEIASADRLNLIHPNNNSYEFHFDGKDATNGADSGRDIIIGTVKFEGYGTFTFEATAGSATASSVEDNLVTDFVVGGDNDKGILIIGTDENKIINEKITVPTQKLTIKVQMNNPVMANKADYQNMSVTISGGDLNGKVLTYKLGDKDETVDETTKTVNLNKNVYKIETDLTKNALYTVSVTGAGYRTARYSVNMSSDKTLNFWNNVKSLGNELAVEEGKDTSKKNVTFLAGDIVKDGIINIYDLSAVVSYFGEDNLVTNHPEYAQYDLNRDGKIDSKDVAYVLVSWGK